MWNQQQLILMKIVQIALTLSVFNTQSLPSHPTSWKDYSNIIYEELYVEKVADDLTMILLYLGSRAVYPKNLCLNPNNLSTFMEVGTTVLKIRCSGAEIWQNQKATICIFACATFSSEISIYSLNKLVQELALLLTFPSSCCYKSNPSRKKEINLLTILYLFF